MKIIYDPAFLEKLKKADVRIRKSLKEKILLFSQNPNSPELNNHPLKREYEGHSSIDITTDWRALYKKRTEGDEKIAYFVFLGTHAQLYR